LKTCFYYRNQGLNHVGLVIQILQLQIFISSFVSLSLNTVSMDNELFFAEIIIIEQFDFERNAKRFQVLSPLCEKFAT
jgi:hypothetical protein